jgi:hypothetical protein
MELLNTVHDQLTVPGAEFLPRQLTIEHSASDDDLRDVHHLLHSITAYSAWWFGDFLFHVQTRTTERTKAELLGNNANPEDVEGLAAKRGNEHVWSVIRGAYDSEAAAFSWQVCKLIKPEQRTFNLSFKHYKEALVVTGYDVKAALGWLKEAEENNWSVSELRKQVRLAQADKSATLTIESLNRASLYQHIHSLYSFVRLCDVDKDAPILDQLERDARSLIKVINEKRNVARVRDRPIGVPEGRSAHLVRC